MNTSVMCGIVWLMMIVPAVASDISHLSAPTNWTTDYDSFLDWVSSSYGNRWANGTCLDRSTGNCSIDTDVVAGMGWDT